MNVYAFFKDDFEDDYSCIVIDMFVCIIMADDKESAESIARVSGIAWDSVRELKQEKFHLYK